MASLILISILAMTVTTIYGQSYGNYNPPVKSGSCSPALPVDICTRTCYYDNQCLGIAKCCPTSCGGFICSRPVTTRNPEKIGTIKPGSCPDPSIGRWTCSSTCTDDSDCQETRKCCRTRCGGLICKKPQITDEIVIPNNGVDIYSNSIPIDNNNNDNNNNFNNYPNPNRQPMYNANRENPFLFSRPQ